MRFIPILMISCLSLTGCFGLSSNELSGGNATKQVAASDEGTKKESMQEDSKGDPTKDTTIKGNNEGAGGGTINVTSNGTSEGDGEGNVEKSTQSGNSNPTSNQDSQYSSTSSSPQSPAVGNVGTTEAEIQAKYQNQMSLLQGYYTGRLSSLYNQALAEAKEGKLSKKDIYAKYAGTANGLKEESQAKVNQTLEAMREELKAIGAPTNSVDEFRAAYYFQINQVKGEVLGRLKGGLGI